MPIIIKKPLKWLYPFSIEREYEQFLLDDISFWESEIKRILIPRLPAWIAEEEARKQRKDIWAEDINTVMTELHLTIGRRAEAFLNNELPFVAGKTDTFNKGQWNKIVKNALGVDLISAEPWLKDQIDKWVSDNANLIRQLRTETLNKVHNIVSEGVVQGRRAETISSRILNDAKIKSIGASPYDSSVSALRKAKKRAKLIADDQVGKLNSQLTERRQGDLGIQRYRWRNVGDRRVRGNPIGLFPNSTYDHWGREGKIYSWEKPPPDGHPGYPVRCRCWAEAVLEDVVDYDKSKTGAVRFKSPKQIIKDVKTPVTDDVTQMFKGLNTPDDVIGSMRKHPGFGFINQVSFNKTIAQKGILQFGLFRMRMGNLLRGAIKRGDLPVKKIKVIPTRKIIKKPKKVVISVSKNEFINEIKNKNYESMGIFDSKTGKKLAIFTQHKKYTVDLSLNKLKFTKGNVTLHNHPGDVPFSFTDITSAVSTRVSVNEVVTSKSLYKMSKIKRYKGDALDFFEEFNPIYKNIQNKNIKKYRNLYNKGKISAKKANILFQHDTIKEFVEKTKLFTYERIPIEDIIKKPMEPKISFKGFKTINQAENWLNVNFGDQLKGLTKKHKDAIEWYLSPVTSNFKQINNTLRGLEVTKSQWQKDLIKRRIKLIKEVINKNKLPENTIAYRAMSIKNFAGEDPSKLIGDVFSDKGFVSTSLIKDSANDFIRNKRWRSVTVRAKIKLPKGLNTIAGNIKPEQEIILPASTKFKIVKVRKGLSGAYIGRVEKGQLWDIELEAIK